jgi:hypothetical protein
MPSRAHASVSPSSAERALLRPNRGWRAMPCSDPAPIVSCRPMCAICALSVHIYNEKEKPICLTAHRHWALAALLQVLQPKCHPTAIGRAVPSHAPCCYFHAAIPELQSPASTSMAPPGLLSSPPRMPHHRHPPSTIDWRPLYLPEHWINTPSLASPVAELLDPSSGRPPMTPHRPIVAIVGSPILVILVLLKPLKSSTLSHH